MNLNDVPVAELGYSLAGLLYRGYKDQYRNLYYLDTETGTETEILPSADEVAIFLNRFELVQDTILDPKAYTNVRQAIFLEKETGELWGLEFSNDSWEDDGSFGEYFDWFPAVETEKVIKIYQKK